MKIKLEIDLEIIEEFKDNKDVIARINYPNEGNKIQVIKGLNKLDFTYAIFHEVSHLFDWYLSNSKNTTNQSENVDIREKIAFNLG